MLYDLICHRKNTLYMTDELPKVKARLKELRQSLRGQGTTFFFQPAAEDAVKYRRPPNMNFDPSGDAGSKKHRHRKAQAKKIKKLNRKWSKD